MLEASLLFEFEQDPVDTHIVEECRAALALNQRVRDAYRRKHFPGAWVPWLVYCEPYG